MLGNFKPHWEKDNVKDHTKFQFQKSSGIELGGVEDIWKISRNVKLQLIISISFLEFP